MGCLVHSCTNETTESRITRATLAAGEGHTRSEDEESERGTMDVRTSMHVTCFDRRTLVLLKELVGAKEYLLFRLAVRNR